MKVVKFGGTSVSSPEKMMHCARMIKKEAERGEKIVVVVSALAGDTERLLALTSGLRIPKDFADEIVSMGERTSSRLMCAALGSLGLKSAFIDPMHQNWPIFTDANHGTADVMLGETKQKVFDTINPLLENGVIPVIGGFIGKTKEGKVTTLGRGGGDITGVLLGHCLQADVYIVTDVPGVFSADPNRAKNARRIDKIGIEELWDLGINGAKVLHPKSLAYKTPEMKLWIVSNEAFLDWEGTEILGHFASETRVTCDHKEKSSISVVGRDMSETRGLLEKFSCALRRINIYSVSASNFSITFFVDLEEEEEALGTLHEVVLADSCLKAVTSKRGIALIVVLGRMFPQKRGTLARIGRALEEEDINIININTSSCEANIFVEWHDRKKAMSVLKKTLEAEE